VSAQAAVAVAPLALVDGLRLADALRAGIYRLFTRTDHLNKINVFPVPDGDTGTNMAMTCGAVLSAIERGPETHAGALLTRIADAAIDGARGNSGAILAQFLLGLGDKLGQCAQLSVTEFVPGLRGAAQYARDALSEPREGTILSVASDFAGEAERLLTAGLATDFRALFERALQTARRSLAATADQLAELRAAHVVDAGAEGFVTLIEGMSHYFSTGEVGTAIAASSVVDEEMAPAATENISYRYCTECLVAGASLDLRRIRETMTALGTSLVVAGSQRKARIHLHSNEPEQVFGALAKFGIVSAQKADDMLRQQHATHHARSQQVAIVVDSAADIPDEMLEKFDLHMVPVRVHFGTRSYLDKVTLSADELYRELANNPAHPKTSQPPPGDYRRIYEFLVSHYQGVVVVSLSAKVSGTYNAALTAAERIAAQRVKVVDSYNVSLGQGLIALHAAECARAGQSLEQVLAATEQARSRTTTLGLLVRTDYAVRGGRVPKIAQVLAHLLRLAPLLVVYPDGRVSVGGALWGRHNLTARFARRVLRRMRSGTRYRVAVAHGNAEPAARELLDEILRGHDNIESSYLVPLGTALGVHGGPGTLVAAFQEYLPLQADKL
jgi:DegV family protein with EDD domain